MKQKLEKIYDVILPRFWFTEILIWDLLNYIDDYWSIYRRESVNDWIVFTIADKILELWKEKVLPIEDQSEDCIEYVYTLIK